MALIRWNPGTPITGEGSVALYGSRCRVSLTSIATYLSKSGTTPPRYFRLGVVGFVYGTVRDLGQVIRYAQQGYIDVPEAATGIYWTLETGVSGTLYQGV